MRLIDLSVSRAATLLAFCSLAISVATADEQPAPTVDATTLHHKVLCGYQGWFNCPGDPAGGGWMHWSRDRQQIHPETLTFEMWPDMSDYDEDEKYLAPGFTFANGQPAHLFSSANPKTIARHFDWMRQYDLDGVLLQRFLVRLKDSSLDLVLRHARESAERTGRTYAICYDLTGMPADKLYDTLVADWKRLVDDDRVTADGRYLHHRGKPVVMVWGFFSDRFGPELAHRIIDFFQRDGAYSATLIGAGEWWWRSEKDSEWAKAFLRFDVFSPWNVGNVALIDGQKQAVTSTWKDDLATLQQAGREYLPVIYPGFGWTNLMGQEKARDSIPRLGGEFFWRQFHAAAELKIDMAYVAMFDEVDEATAIFKVSNRPPSPGRFQTFDGLPADWYLRLTGEGTRMIRGDLPLRCDIPIRP